MKIVWFVLLVSLVVSLFVGSWLHAKLQPADKNLTITHIELDLINKIGFAQYRVFVKDDPEFQMIERVEFKSSAIDALIADAASAAQDRESKK